MSDKTASTSTWNIDAKYPVSSQDRDKSTAEDPTETKKKTTAQTTGSTGGNLDMRNMGPVANLGPTVSSEQRTVGQS